MTANARNGNRPQCLAAVIDEHGAPPGAARPGEQWRQRRGAGGRAGRHPARLAGAGAGLSKDELLDEVWPGLVVEENNLQLQISGLRRVLGTQAITTVSALGYRFTLAPGPSATRLADAGVLVARLQGLDAGPETHAPQAAMDLLSDWRTLMFDAVTAHSGEVIQFGGDGLIALFAQPASTLAAARDRVALSAQFNRERALAQQAPACFGIGLARGAVVVGLASTSQRTAYACIGAPMLRAAQLASDALQRRSADGA